LAIEGFAPLLALYRLALKDKRVRLRRHFEALRDTAGSDHGPEAVEREAQELRSLLHKLAGSAGAYGFDELGDDARLLERRWIAYLAQPVEARTPIRTFCDAIEPACRAVLIRIDAAIAAAGLAAEEMP
jgi:HPt (histidine-containing phosphotransfer) domain-containing protein